MNLMVCTDDNGGLMFHHRRQSQDGIVRQDMLEEAGMGRLWMNSYSYGQFLKNDISKVIADDHFLEKAGPGDYCFVENEDALPYFAAIEKIVRYQWNRVYPSDFYFSIDLSGEPGLRKIRHEEFAGSSHEKITKEVFIKEFV